MQELNFTFTDRKFKTLNKKKSFIIHMITFKDSKFINKFKENIKK